MNHESENEDWPPEAGDRESLATVREPPAELEDRVVAELMQRGLLRAEQSRAGRHIGWRAVRASLAAAACVALVAVGVLIGRMSLDSEPATTTLLTGAETDLYALLLYETDGYDRATGAEAMSRYSEYSKWISDGRRRGQFVTGEDLDVDHGWLLMPSRNGVEVERATSIAADAPLSGILFIRATDADHALDLARELPHIRHGGQVLVQKTVPTDTPPPAGSD